MILAVATGNGLRKEIKNKITGFGGDLQILNYKPNPVYDQVPLKFGDSLAQAIEKHSEIRHWQRFGRKAGIIKTDTLFEGAILKGLGQRFDQRQHLPYLTAGKVPRYGGTGYNDSVVLSMELSQRLHLKLGDSFLMYFLRKSDPPLRRKFTVAGLYQTDFEDIDKNFLLGDLNHVRRLNGWGAQEIGGLEIYLDEGVQSAQVLEGLRQILPFQYNALSARELNPQLFQWLDLFDTNIIIILVIIIIVATVNMSIALLILIMERTRMIGILKALGAGNWSVQKIFLINAGYLMLKGLFFGNLIGIGLGLIQQQWGLIKLDPRTYYVSQVSVDLDPGLILALNLGVMLICLLCLLLPALLISRLRPVKALRFD